MQKSVSRRSPDPRTSVWIVFAMLAMIILPAAITLNAVRLPGELQIREEEDPTPYGYSWSLLLFIVPILVIAFVFLPRAEIKIPRKAFWWTVGILAPIGCATDFLFASRFFVFKNPGATWRIEAPALNKPVPIEEYIFYVTGFIAILLIYLWLDEYWLAKYAEPDYRAESKTIPRLVQFHPLSAIFWHRTNSSCCRLQENVFVHAGGTAGIFHVSRVGWVCSFRRLFPNCPTVR
jgi:hypothetical protein